MKPMRPIETQSIHQQLQERIKQFILDNKLKPGDPLPTEATLVAELNVSRAVVREGFRSLESLGMIYSRQGEGRYVSSFSLEPVVRNLGYSMLTDVEDVREILDVRECLELGFVDKAIAAMDGPTLEQLESVVATMRARPKQLAALLEADLAFHRAIFSVVGNRLLMKLLDVFWEVYRNLRDESVHVPREPLGAAQMHEAILEAIRARDAEAARRLISEHFQDLRSRLESAVATHDQGKDATPQRAAAGRRRGPPGGRPAGRHT